MAINWNQVVRAKDKELTASQQYLNDTDWYVIRKAETGVEIPAEIQQLREEARRRL